MSAIEVMRTIALMAIAYLAGSIPFSFLVAKAWGVDLRTVGSGNIGGANVWRSCGFGAFLLAVAGDLGKGLLPTLAALHLAGLRPVEVILVGLCSILGHTFPVFLNFRGGKAVATSGGVLLAVAPLLMLIGLVAWALAFAVVRISSVGSLTAAAAVAIAAGVLLATGQLDLAYALFVWAVVALIVYLHRENIQRLRAGTENRFVRK
ncbi:MAG TPA: glycerol-3-phosphate 1-O-acyltransferase PlsY [Roseiflexaceae bacterium]|nr:glycerol-3-phosphate 1-O-acyltransferase PlsY [Roseiflexaceae bacterium]